MFNFNPEDGLLNTQEFPDKPSSGTVARNQFMRLFNQIKDYINGMESGGVKAKGGNADTLEGKQASYFSPSTHTHSNYAASNHNHDDTYSKTSHTHSNYAASNHNHNGVYANASHSHDYVNNSNWSNNSGKIKGKNIFVQQSQPSPGDVGDVWISW